MTGMRIHWFEGMFLRPHHFQRNDEYWSHQLHAAVIAGNPNHYGFTFLDIDRSALDSSAQVVVNGCEAYMRDGTIVSLAAPLTLPLSSVRAALSKADPVAVVLSVPSVPTGGGEDVGLSSPSGDYDSGGDVAQDVDARAVFNESSQVSDESSRRRWRRKRASCVDLNTGANRQNIVFQVPDVRLGTSTDVMGNAQVLDVLRFRSPASQDERIADGLALDVEFVPPLLSLKASQPARRRLEAFWNRLRKVIGDIRGSIGNDAGPVVTAGQLERRLALSAVQRAYGRLGAMITDVSGIWAHPWCVFVELCSLAAELGVGELPAYDHANLNESLFGAIAKIDKALGSAPQIRVVGQSITTGD